MEAALNGPAGRIPLGGTGLTIGRAPDNGFVIADPKASSHHVEIHQEGQGYSLVDLGSTNGTFVNEQRLSARTPHMLRAGEVIRIGDTNFTYEASEPSGIDATVYAAPPQEVNPGYQATVAAPPPDNYGVPAPRQDYPDYQAAPPPAYPLPQQNYVPPVQQGYAPPPLPQNYNIPSQQGYVPQQSYSGYGQQGAVPSFGVPQAQPRKSRRGLWITLSVIAGILLLSCIACGAFAYLNTPTPKKTLDNFCNGINTGDEHAAYQQLSTNLQSSTSEAKFSAALTNIKRCSHTEPVESSSGNSATAGVTLIDNTGQQATGTAKLIDESANGWKIESINFPTS